MKKLLIVFTLLFISSAMFAACQKENRNSIKPEGSENEFTDNSQTNLPTPTIGTSTDLEDLEDELDEFEILEEDFGDLNLN